MRQSERFDDYAAQADQLQRPRPALSLLLLARRDRRGRHRHRSRWRAALSRHLPAPVASRGQVERFATAAIRCSGGSKTDAAMDRDRHADLHRRRPDCRSTARRSAMPGRSAGAMWCCSARAPRPAITSASWSTTPRRASPTSPAAATWRPSTDIHVLLQMLLGLHVADLYLPQADPRRRRQESSAKSKGSHILREPSRSRAGRRQMCDGHWGSRPARFCSTKNCAIEAAMAVVERRAEIRSEQRVEAFVLELHRIAPEVAHLGDLAHDRIGEAHRREENAREMAHLERHRRRRDRSPHPSARASRSGRRSGSSRTRRAHCAARRAFRRRGPDRADRPRHGRPPARPSARACPCPASSIMAWSNQSPTLSGP